MIANTSDKFREITLAMCGMRDKGLEEEAKQKAKDNG
jgi:hypothetical protein